MIFNPKHKYMERTLLYACASVVCAVTAPTMNTQAQQAVLFWSGCGHGVTQSDADDAYVSPAVQLTKGCKYKVATNGRI